MEACGNRPPATVPALEARRLTLSWDGGSHVVARDVSLVVGKGELVCLLGRSGCGKTTILHALAGLSRPLGGQVLLRGQDVTGKAGNVSYMLQKDLLLPSKRIIDNVCLPLVLAGVPTAEAHERAKPLFERFGLAGCERLWPSELSGGMRQRAAFLRTYLMGHDVVLLDEPFSALDALTRADMRSWYCQMSARLGISSLAITHDVDEAVMMASRIYVLEGNPAAGVPSRVAAEVKVPVAREGLSAAEFALMPEFLACKREVLSHLG
ncbi:ABC transporter ATP-binding protein [Olsenella urininfantis]|uniref:ABC transporter ATP-binding protein n=1 Tax=Olsenella urininfantis TaxID=1871033 RepID=UPI00190E618F|nr:ABC transporter ATP-binding protein [Olsenella urininfantis]